MKWAKSMDQGVQKIFWVLQQKNKNKQLHWAHGGGLESVRVEYV